MAGTAPNRRVSPTNSACECCKTLTKSYHIPPSVVDMSESCTNTIRHNLAACDAHVVQSNESAAHLRRSDLSNVQRNDHSGRANTKADDQTTNRHLSNTVCRALKNSTNCEQNTSNVNGNLAAILVGSQARDDCSNECAAGAERCDELFLVRRRNAAVQIRSQVHEDCRYDAWIELAAVSISESRRVVPVS